MQHIVVNTARKANLAAADWTTNGVGRLGKGVVAAVRDGIEIHVS